MKAVLILIFITNVLFAAKVVKVDDMYQKSKNCKACHIHIVKEWEQSWHSKSHYENDEYFRASIDYISRKTRKSLNSVKVKCANCHNPRISITDTDADYEIMAVMELDKNSEVDKALHSDSISEGINCVVCHNIDVINHDKDESKRGIKRVEWTQSGTMTGPFDDAVSPYHQTSHRDFMDKDPNTLCFVCHANDRAVKGLVFTDMKSEYIEGSKKCVDCHMGAKTPGVASTYKSYGGKAKEREIRGHKFSGAHVPTMWEDALKLDLLKKGRDVVISISNPHPHNIPSGFGARELIVDITYKSDSIVLEPKSISLTTHYTSKRKKPTIPHLAVKMTKNMTIPAQGKKVLKVPTPTGATNIEVKLYYRLVNNEVHKILKLKEKIWSRKSFIASKELKLLR